MTIYRRGQLPAAVAQGDALRIQIGMTWTDTRPTSTGDPFMAVLPRQAQHIIDFGAPSNLSPSAGVYNLSALAPFVVDMIDAGATRPHIILCRAPGWAKVSGVDSDDLSPVPSARTNWAALCAAVVSYFDGRDSSHPLVEYYSYWNEMKGYEIPSRAGDPTGFAAYEASYGTAQPAATPGNHRDYVRYTTDYNAVWTACKAARSTIKMGGPYVIMEAGDGTWSHGPSSVTFTGGSFDQRALDAMTYFVANATGYDFLSCDGGIGNQHGTAIPTQDPNLQVDKFWKWWNWVRSLGGAAATVPLINFETYIAIVRDPPHSYTKAQCDDLMIEMLRQTKANVTGEVTYLTWGHPVFYPQVVADDGAFPSSAWSSPNTAATFKNRANTWNTTGAP